MAKKYNYVYRIVNKLNKMEYIGVHSTNDMEDGYFGSGTYLCHAIKKYGRENFEKQIIQIFDDRNSALTEEKKMVSKSYVQKKSVYNLVLGGGLPRGREKTIKKFGKNIQMLLTFDGYAKDWKYNVDIDKEKRIKFTYNQTNINTYKKVNRIIYYLNDFAYRFTNIIVDMIPSICKTLNNTYNDKRYHKYGRKLIISLLSKNWIDPINNNGLIIISKWEGQKQI